MRELRTRQKVKRFLFSAPVALLLLLMLVFLARSTWQVYGKMRSAEGALKRSRAEAADLSQRKVTLESEIQSLETPEGVEAEIRETFNMARPGEELVIVVEEKDAAAEGLSSERSLWQKILHFLHIRRAVTSGYN